MIGKTKKIVLGKAQKDPTTSEPVQREFPNWLCRLFPRWRPSLLGNLGKKNAKGERDAGEGAGNKLQGCHSMVQTMRSDGFLSANLSDEKIENRRTEAGRTQGGGHGTINKNTSQRTFGDLPEKVRRKKSKGRGM